MTVETKPITPINQRDLNAELQRQFVKYLYESSNLNEEFRASAAMFSEIFHIPAHIIQNTARYLDEKGVLSRRSQMTATGKAAFWTIKEPLETAMQEIEELQYRNGNRIQSKIGNRARLNPNIAKSVKDWREAKAWADSTRKYMQRSDALAQKLNELRALGIEIDEETFYKSVDLKHDDTFATLALLIPYIDFLEAKVKAK